MSRLRDVARPSVPPRALASGRVNPRRRVQHMAPFLWSGAGKAISALVCDQRQYLDVSVVTSPASGELRNWPEYERSVRRARIPHHHIDLFHRDPATFWGAVDAVASRLSARRPDVIHAHAGVSTAVALLARERLGEFVPVVSHVYSWGIGRPAWMNAMDLWAHRQADVVVCSARSYERLLLDAGVARARLRFVPWGVTVTTDVGAAKGRRAEARSIAHLAPASRGERAHGAFVLGTVGRIEPRKNQLGLVEAFARLATTVPGARLELVGPAADAAYAATLTERVQCLGLGSRITVHGHVDDVARVVRGWSLYVSLSSDEGQGLAVLEAMAMGVPVAALIVPGVEDYLRDGETGFALASAAPQRVAASLTRLIATPGALGRVARNAVRMVDRRFSWAHTVSAIDAIYAEVLDGATRTRQT